MTAAQAVMSQSNSQLRTNSTCLSLNIIYNILTDIDTITLTFGLDDQAVIVSDTSPMAIPSRLNFLTREWRRSVCPQTPLVAKA